MPLTAQNEERIDRGRRANAARLELQIFAAEREERIVADLVTAYRNRALTYEYCIGKVGELVALRDLLATLGGYETQGHVAKEKAHGPA